MKPTAEIKTQGERENTDPTVQFSPQEKKHIISKQIHDDNAKVI
jgi:hypothetical protein